MDFSEPWSDTCSSVGLAARSGNIKLLKKLIKEKKCVDAPDNRGWKPLHEAAAFSPNVECLAELLKHPQTDVNWKTHEGETALLLACKRRKDDQNASEFVKLLLQNGADPNIDDNEADNPLLKALRNENKSIVEQLLEAGADVNAQDCARWSPLHEAATKGDPFFIQLLLDKNADIEVQDECGMTPFFTAAQHGSEKCLAKLLDAATEQELECVVNRGAEDWATPLMIAAQKGYENCVKQLVAFGADANKTTTDHATALHLAVQGNKTRCLELLIPHMNLDILIKRFHPLSCDHCFMICPLHLAIEWKSYESLEVLLQAGFSPNSLYYTNMDDIVGGIRHIMMCGFERDSSVYESALSYAVGKGDTRSMSILLAAGADCKPVVYKSFHPILRAMLSHKRDTFHLLLQHNCDINFRGTRNSHNESILISFLTHPYFLVQLLYHGADPNQCFGPYNDGTTFRFCARHLIDNKMREEVFLAVILRFMVYKRTVHNVFRMLVSDRSVLPEDFDGPSPLKQLCSIHIRQHLYNLHKAKLPEMVEKLNLPPCLTTYVTGRDILDLASSEDFFPILNGNFVYPNLYTHIFAMA